MSYVQNLEQYSANRLKRTLSLKIMIKYTNLVKVENDENSIHQVNLVKIIMEEF